MVIEQKKLAQIRKLSNNILAGVYTIFFNGIFSLIFSVFFSKIHF